MALGATIYKATLDISDLDRGWYGSRSLTVARHPSETEERMMVRILAFCLYADEKLEFGRGLSAEDPGVRGQAHGRERGDCLKPGGHPGVHYCT